MTEGDPKWESKILQYYKNLFTANDHQKSQMIFATHSVHVLKEALQDQKDSVVIVLKEENGIINCNKIDAPKVLPSITIAETTYLAFDMLSNDYHIELYGWLQEKENLDTVKQCDDYIKNHPNYVPSKHAKSSKFKNTTYASLCTYIRNAIHHPNTNNKFTESELRASIELLITLCK